MTSSELNILISSAGRRVALLEAFRRGLQGMGLGGRVLAADISPLASAFQRADAGFIVPRCTESAFVPHMLDLCERERIGLIIPTIDTELPSYAAHREAFAARGALVAVSSPETIAVAHDKRLTHAWLVDNQFPTVAQADPAELLREGDASRWLPAIVKPVRGSSSIGVRTVRSVGELEAATRDGDYVVQSIAAGVEYTTDTFVGRDGRCVTAIPRRRLEVRGGEVSKGMTVRQPEIERVARAISERLPGAFGVLNVQAFRDPSTGAVRVIEINPRFGGGAPLSLAAGARFVERLIALASRRESPPADDEWIDGLVMLRYDDAVFVLAKEVGLSGGG